MMRPVFRAFTAISILLAHAAAGTAAQTGGAAHDNADVYPGRPVRFIVPFPPGGSDTVARIIGQQLTERLGQNFVVDNRPGAASILGTDLAAKAAPDGYTLLFATSAFAISAALYKKLPYDPLQDFAPITLAAVAPNILVAHPLLPVNTVKELIALAKAKPDGLNYASNGSGSITFLAMEMFKSVAGIRITEVPYKGAGPSLIALLSGEVQLMMAPLGPSVPHVRAGRLKGIAVPGTRRSALFPEIPTVAESGLNGFEATNWYAVLVPRGVSPPVIAKLNQHIVAVLKTTEVQEKFAALGYEPTPSTPKELSLYVQAEIARWAKVIKDAAVPRE